MGRRIKPDNYCMVFLRSSIAVGGVTAELVQQIVCGERIKWVLCSTNPRVIVYFLAAPALGVLGMLQNRFMLLPGSGH